MSYYDDDRAPRRQKSTRERARRDDYDGGTVYDENVRDTRIVKRRDDSVSSVEEVSRDFAPGDRGGPYYRETTVRKSGHRPVRTKSDDDRWYDDRYDDSTYVSRRRHDDDQTVAGARGRREKDRGEDRGNRRRSRRRDDSYSSYSSRSRTPPKKERRKSTTEEVLGSLGLGGVAGALLGKNRDRSASSGRSRQRSRSRAGGRRRSSSGRSTRRSKSKGKITNEQVSQALKAAVLAGATEAFRSRKEPGGWGADKGKRVLTAALAAGGVDGLISNKDNPDHHNKRDILGSAIAGLATTRIINGPRSKSRGRGSQDGRGRSQSRGGLGDLAAGGVVAATAKKAYDRFRSRSRGRARSRSSSYDSYSQSPPRRKRSQSVAGYAAKGLAALGLKDAAEKVDPNRSRRSSRHYDDYSDDGRNGGYYNDPRDVGTNQPQQGHPSGGPRSMSLPRGHPPGYELDYGPRHTGDPETDSDSDLGSSSEDERQRKKGKQKLLLTGGLATVATIHAAHNVYQSMEKRNERRHALKEGEISKQQAKGEKNKARLQDAASIGIAALGLKGAYSEWKEMKEYNHEMREEKEKIERHAKKREARRRKMSLSANQDYVNSDYTGSMPNLATYPNDPYYPAGAPRYASQSTVHYNDDNPYGAVSQPPPPAATGFPPPPIGLQHQPTR
ncbi:hypothetical protein LTR10_016602 [Elasticomyces elasticus]|uniref:DUF3824 domain-containing protein n=1 Tax=Exophiala sideris TaxID=1016849 RepID=A0ABR0JJM3_9EURO|nr:hypothetical protein LTR10_016602 [Elasticomyces elasticus]KAK5035247.1 hypothetical protein LTS07_002683 [Exophiala sideris]KAK5039401.1 hypothetical protein LTR13_003658 [Exophiala sideris]KAK5066171.1 hypothetical protein LTR69_002689 [Exophiala sideris]KAK5186848.1 hypothetical protein LTR44_000854 [Eurotiomycetes sp. CCFEE 6388]